MGGYTGFNFQPSTPLQTPSNWGTFDVNQFDAANYVPSSYANSMNTGGITEAMHAKSVLGTKPPLGDKSMTNAQGWGVGLGVASTALQGYMGMRQNRLAEKQYKASQNQFAQNMAMQKGNMRGDMRARYRTALNPEKLGANESEYMASYGL